MKNISLRLVIAAGLVAVTFASGAAPSKEEYRRFALSHPGDVARGKRLFEDSSKLACARCHATDGKTAKAAPDLSTVGDKFNKYRDAAGIDKAVTFSWIRDAAYSIAMQASTFDKAELLAGHRLPGTADAYLRRNPQLVAEACRAIRAEFYTPKAKESAA